MSKYNFYDSHRCSAFAAPMGFMGPVQLLKIMTRIFRCLIIDLEGYL